MAVAEWIVYVAMLYSAAGIVFAIYFVARIVSKIDQAAERAGMGFRFLIFPGAAVFWPLLMMRWIRGTWPGADEGDSHAFTRAGQKEDL